MKEVVLRKLGELEVSDFSLRSGVNKRQIVEFLQGIQDGDTLDVVKINLNLYARRNNLSTRTIRVIKDGIDRAIVRPVEKSKTENVNKSVRTVTAIAGQMRALKELYDRGIISEEVYQEALQAYPEREESDIYINNSGMLCIAYVYRTGKWMIRIPLGYDYRDYIKEMYPLSTSTQGRKNKALLDFINRNRIKLQRLDEERKQKFLREDEKSGVKSEPKRKSRIIPVANKGNRW